MSVSRRAQRSLKASEKSGATAATAEQGPGSLSARIRAARGDVWDASRSQPSSTQAPHQAPQPASLGQIAVLGDRSDRIGQDARLLEFPSVTAGINWSSAHLAQATSSPGIPASAEQDPSFGRHSAAGSAVPDLSYTSGVDPAAPSSSRPAFASGSLRAPGASPSGPHGVIAGESIIMETPQRAQAQQPDGNGAAALAHPPTSQLAALGLGKPIALPPSGARPGASPMSAPSLPRPADPGAPTPAPTAMPQRSSLGPLGPPVLGGAPRGPPNFSRTPQGHPPLSQQQQQQQQSSSPRIGITSPRSSGLSPEQQKGRAAVPASPYGVQQQRRQAPQIDPAQMPRPKPQAAEEEPRVYETWGEGGACPPPATHDFIVRDRGNATPRAMRPTLHLIPAGSDLLKQSGMALAVILQPLAAPLPGDSPLQVVDFGDMGPVRCSNANCRAYINPYFKFFDAGRRFYCNLCSAESNTPEAYVPLAQNRRLEGSERPELSCGTVEFCADLPQFQVRSPMRDTHVFLLDVSPGAIASGATQAACSAVSAAIAALPDSERTRIGLATFDNQLQFWSLRGAQQQVVGDTAEPFCPVPSSSLPALDPALRPLLADVLERIPQLQQQLGPHQPVCTAAAIDAGVQMLQAGEGGKLHVFLTSLPKNAGKHSLEARDQSHSQDDPQLSLQPGSKSFLALAASAAEYQVSVDLFVMSRSHVDLASLASISRMTTGQVYHYHPFHASIHAPQLLNDLRWNVSRPQGLEAIARLRCSKGLAVEKYWGHCYRRTLTDLEFPNLSCEHSLAATLRYEDRLAENGGEAFLQFATLFTTPQGQRRIRVHTLGLRVTGTLGTIFRGADLDALICVLAHQTAASLPGGTLKAAGDVIKKAVIEALFSYRKHCASSSAAGQLVLPEQLKLYPLLSLSLMKCPALRKETRQDARIAWLHHLATAPVARLMGLVHPSLYDLNAIVEASPGEPARLPLPIGAISAAKVLADGVYLLENGAFVYIYIGPDVPAELQRQLLGVDSIEDVSQEKAVPLPLPVLQTPFSQAVHEILHALRTKRTSFMAVEVIKRGGYTEAAFQSALVEDRSPAGSSYVEFLCAVHREIQGKSY
ncbi:hypothetical protein WJX84_009840 [Apatococcus fuscideae]|uniref:Uncharacterized protein n=1 Tax=Apatococcus fuscideae TaxID=2026836 RepID=A0AAW1SQ90_9CHLO